MTQFYDPLGRVYRTLSPDAAERRVVFGVPGSIASPDLESINSYEPTPWENYTYDANDLADETHHGLTHNVPSEHWYTPRSVKVDSLGRMIESIDRNFKDSAIEEVIMRFSYDIRGNTLQVDDALKIANPGAGRPSAFVHVYDLANKPLKTTHIEKGVQTMVLNAAGLPVEARDAKGALILNSYDELLRPVNLWARDISAETVTLRQHIIYGEDKTDPGGYESPGKAVEAL